MKRILLTSMVIQIINMRMKKLLMTIAMFSFVTSTFSLNVGDRFTIDYPIEGYDNVYYVVTSISPLREVSFGHGWDVAQGSDDIEYFDIPEYVTGPDGNDYCVTGISAYTFYMSHKLHSITIPKTVETIGEMAFYGCSELSSVNGGRGVRTIKSNAFYSCVNLYSFSWSPVLETIKESAFGYCSSLSVVNLPVGFETIESNVFSNCTNLYDIIIPETVTSIGSKAFENSNVGSNNSNVTINCTVPPSLASDAFDKYNATIYVPYGCVNTYKAADGWNNFSKIYSLPKPENSDNLITFADPYVKSLCINNWDTNNDGKLSKTEAAAVTSLGTVFKENRYITSFDELQFFTGLTTIDEKAFQRCYNLRSIIIPNNVTSIGASAFSTCSSLCSITIPNSVTSIGNYAFNSCFQLSSVTIPKGITSIGGNSFYTMNVLDVVIMKENPISISSTVFSEAENSYLYVPYGAKSAYEAAAYWKRFMTIVEMNPPATVVTAPTAKTLTYTGSAQKLVNAGVANGGTMHYSLDGKTYSTTIPTGTNAGTYTVYYKVVGNATHTDSEPSTVNVTINKAAAKVTTAPTAKALTYTGSAQQLINAGVASGGTMQYSLNGTSYSTSIPTGTAVGSYTVYYKVVGDANHSNTNPATVSVTISKAAASVSTAPTAKTLTYTGSAQELINAGVASGGTMQYSLDGANYSTEIPTATIAGTYMVYYKVVGDVNHSDTDPATVSVTIAEYEIEVTDISQIDNVIYIEPMEERTGTETVISFSMKNTAEIRGFQFDLVLPEGVTPVVEDDVIVCELNEDRSPKTSRNKLYHTIDADRLEDGSYRILCGSQQAKTFYDSDGEIAVLYVNIADDMAEGDYPIILKNIKLTETDISNYYATEEVVCKLTITNCILGDISGDGIVDVSDYIGVANHILGNTPSGFITRAADVNVDGTIDVSDYIGIANIILTGSIYGHSSAPGMLLAPKKENTDVSNIDNVIYVPPFTASAGSETVISFSMKNTADIRGFQFDVVLPDGITPVVEDDVIVCELNEDRSPKTSRNKLYHTIDADRLEDGSYRILCGSQQAKTFYDSDGEIAVLYVNIAADMADGDYPIILKNIKLTETDISNYYVTELLESTVTIGEPDTRVVLDETFTTVPATATNVDVRVKRAIKANEWSTICLPFAMTTEKVKAAFGNDVEIGDFTGYEVTEDAAENIVGITVNFADVTAMEANHPYIIKVSTAIDYETGFTVDGVDINPEDEPCVALGTTTGKGKNAVYHPMDFIGTYVADFDFYNDAQGRALFLSGNKFYYATANTMHMKAFRAYFDFDDVLTIVENANAPIFINIGGETTDIRSIDNGQLTMDNVYYDLQGRPVKTPGKGVYIYNGKKVIIK